MTDQHIIQITDTHITLPGCSMLALDACREFTPNRAFWNVWKRFKLDVKRCGVFVRLDESTGEYRGYVREGSQGFGYSQSDLHAYWVQKAQEKADNEICAPVIIGYSELTRPRPRMSCVCFEELEVVAKQCKDNSFQLRLACTACGARTPGAIAWDRLGSEFVVGAIAYFIQNTPEQTEPEPVHPVLDALKDVDTFV